MKKGKLYIISAPSGAGKTSLIKKLVPVVDKLMVSVSHTTRAQRPGEIDAVDYFFTSVDRFQEMIANPAFLEYAQVFDNYYGTAQSSVEQSLNHGKDVILEIDWQGAAQIRRLLPETITIFILPPSTEVLRQRLQGRGQDSTEVIDRRMQDAKTEISHYAEYDYLIVNDDFNTALTDLKSIILANRLNINRQQKQLKSLLTDLLI
ncbi:guanylate kinase [Bathymodiolus platifrons methanotrophic gill symbiont]|uniref:guanylate kinase n=1 Tax=Bathymodiolus platifrons methanotrophic gill symbiont TaxID=113268 RepID=UPI000B421ECA|nr:guanylate kinase [Bathymodiolus platifrons methanotrophic gill symbiont]MCK5870351.1 guanylate kinase [Methyloprofundus sp.]TXL10018.1 guanylate kinase [Methylococcaceae bacterium CS2]GAW86684.1 guanylate kinase [Bathymodiolus platifrons methanotrophic gill symbiont]GFO77408.1 guanylate kinase [Bathymodiolus platifrons methanotrophic gill symbiont]